MDTNKALARISSVLALNTSDHRESAHRDRGLIENARQAERSNIETAKALGFYEEYQRKVNMFGPRLFYEL